MLKGSVLPLWGHRKGKCDTLVRGLRQPALATGGLCAEGVCITPLGAQKV